MSSWSCCYGDMPGTDPVDQAPESSLYLIPSSESVSRPYFACASADFAPHLRNPNVFSIDCSGKAKEGKGGGASGAGKYFGEVKC